MNYLIDLSRTTKIVAVSPNPDRVQFYQRIYNLLENKNKEITFEVSDKYDRPKHKKGKYLVDRVYNETKIKYQGGKKIIAYSISAQSFGEQNLRDNISDFIGDVDNYQYIELGLPQQIEEIVDIISKCSVYVGIDNGVSHLARSMVDCPKILLNARKHDLNHAFPEKYCNYIRAENIDDFKLKIINFVKD